MTEPRWQIATIWHSGLYDTVPQQEINSAWRMLGRARLVLKAIGCNGNEMIAHYHKTEIYPKEVRVR